MKWSPGASTRRRSRRRRSASWTWSAPTAEFRKSLFLTLDFASLSAETAPHSIDQGFKRIAEGVGVNIHYGAQRDRRDCTIIACGPTGTSAFACGEVFRTSYPNCVVFQLNDKLAPGAYTYMLVVDGIGLICTCLWRRQQGTARFLNETIAWYERHYPGLDREPLRRVAGKGEFSILDRYATDRHLFVGESAGLQDFMWGFGIRYAVHSGILAARHCLGECDYDTEVKRQLLPLVKSSAVNRFLFNRIGNRGYQCVVDRWLKQQAKTGDGLAFIRNLYQPTAWRRFLFPLVSIGMLERANHPEGIRIRRLPHRAALNRDRWQPGGGASAVDRRWKETRHRADA